MGAGVKTPNLETVSVSDSVIVNRDGRTTIQPIDKLALQLNADLNIAADREAAQVAILDAKRWADEPEGVQIEAGKFSALHHAAQSEQHATAAEQARDTAFINADVFASTALGLAGTTLGDQFQVISGDEVVRYRHDAGPVAMELARYPTAARVAPLISIAPDGYAYSIVDGFGMVAFGVRDDGSVSIAKINGKNVTEWLAETANAGALIDQAQLGYALSVLDANGNAAVGIKDDGTFAARKIEATFLNGTPVAGIVAGGVGGGKVFRGRFHSEIDMLLSYGQSLSVGTDGTPPISVAQRFDNLRFSGGVRSQDSGSPYTSLVPMIETTAATLGETPITGATDMIKELVAVEDGLAYTAQSYQLLGSAPGAGGSPISGLISGTGAFNRFIADVQAGYDLAQAAGKSFKVGGFFWTQGESDYIGSTTSGTYKAALVTLRDNLETQVQGITGQAEPLVCISYQTQAHATYGHSGNPYIAVAQLEVARENPHHFVACPLYWSTQAIHQSAQNYKRLGAYYGLCYKRVVIDGEDWRPVEPLQVDRQGRVILLRFNVPMGPLVLDTSFRAMQTNYGFSVVDSGGAAVAINSVALVGPDTIKIVTSTAATGGRVRYGTGNGGNLRDGQGDFIIFDGGGQDFPLHNWCVIFDETLS